jgi:hypothetical protein
VVATPITNQRSETHTRHPDTTVLGEREREREEGEADVHNSDTV